MSSNPTAPPITPAASAANEALAIIADVAQTAVTAATPSPAGSSSGFVLSVWWEKNKARMKTVVMLFSGGTTAAIGAIHITMVGPWAILEQTALGASSLLVALLSGLACDWIDHRYTKNPK